MLSFDNKLEPFKPYISNYPQSVPSKVKDSFYFPKNLDYQYFSYSDRFYYPQYRWSPTAHQNEGYWNDDGMGKPLVLKLHYGFSHF